MLQEEADLVTSKGPQFTRLGPRQGHGPGVTGARRAKLIKTHDAVMVQRDTRVWKGNNHSHLCHCMTA